MVDWLSCSKTPKFILNDQYFYDFMLELSRGVHMRLFVSHIFFTSPYSVAWLVSSEFCSSKSGNRHMHKRCCITTLLRTNFGILT